MCTLSQQGAATGDIIRGSFDYLLRTPDRAIDAYDKGDYDGAGKEIGSLLPAVVVAIEGGRVGFKGRTTVVEEVPLTKSKALSDIVEVPVVEMPVEGSGVKGVTAAEGVANSELTIASNSANGNPAAIARGIGDLNSRQTAVLEELSGVGSRTITSKAIGQNDLAALTAATGDEFAMFTTGGRRLVIRGDATSVPITPELATDLASQGWRWSSHVHPGFDASVLRSSIGDRAVLDAMGGNQSTIFNSLGQRRLFTPAGDSLNGWTPW